MIAGGTYVYAPDRVTGVVPGSLTTTSAGPAVPAGVVAVMAVPAPLTDTCVAGAPPIVTVESGPKPDPEIVTT